ncbi:unnamed protein product [Rotaria sp. Silwood1]|nr:unnamed protein product [Rotaria sp. Silwood1]
MRGVAQAYNNAEDWSTRRSILSIVAPKISYQMITYFIPGLTPYRYTSARLHAATIGTAVMVEPKESTVQHGLTVHRAYEVGEGKRFSWKDLKPLKDVPALESKYSTLPENATRFTAPSIAHSRAISNTKTKLKDSLSISTEQKEGISEEIFECNEDGCVEKFFKLGNLLRHICNGKHTLLPERQCLGDTAALIYTAKLETIESKQMCSMMLETSRRKALYDDQNRFPPLPQGWGLPSERKHTRLSNKQVKYLTERFDEALHKENPIRWKPETVAEHMREYKISGKFLFSPEEFLKVSQIRSFFSRLSAKRKNLPRTEENGNENENENEEAIEEELALEAEELLETVSKSLLSVDEPSSPVSVKRPISNPALTEPKRSSFRLKKEK